MQPIFNSAALLPTWPHPHHVGSAFQTIMAIRLASQKTNWMTSLGAWRRWKSVSQSPWAQPPFRDPHKYSMSPWRLRSFRL